jgi:hypothetical protein
MWPDARRFILPGSDLAAAFPALAQVHPDQPRVSAGSADGGQWTDGSGGTAQPMGEGGFGDLAGSDGFAAGATGR